MRCCVAPHVGGCIQEPVDLGSLQQCGTGCTKPGGCSTRRHLHVCFLSGMHACAPEIACRGGLCFLLPLPSCCSPGLGILLCMQTMLERACMIACCMLVLLALPRHCLSALLGARTRSHVEATSVLLTRPRPASAGHQQVSCWSACLAYTVSL